MPHRRCVKLLFCGMLASVGFILPSRADAAALSRDCAPATISQVRMLASARVPKVHRLCVQAHKSATVVRFYHHRGRWAVAPRYATAWQIPGVRYRQVVRKNRAILRYHRHRLTKLEGLIKVLTEPVAAPLGPKFMCIHRFEGAWDDDTGNGYYGGLQMDYTFMRTYGADYLARWGTANEWPAWAQLEVAERAYRSGRGFWPWPNSARACGLL